MTRRAFFAALAALFLPKRWLRGAFQPRGPHVVGAGQTGISLTTAGWSGTEPPHVGDVFTLPGVNAVNPRTGKATEYRKHFVVTSAPVEDAEGNVVLSLWPPITPSGLYRSASSAPKNGAKLTIPGAPRAKVAA